MTNRRELLRLLAASAPAATGMGLWPSSMLAQAEGAGLIAANVCRLTTRRRAVPRDGPFYLEPQLMRADIREDRGGVPMTMRIQVVGGDGRPIRGAQVGIWHCDAQGNYSGFAGHDSGPSRHSRETFLRGAQICGEAGEVAFRTIFPGWYRGRTTHIHFNLSLGRGDALTGQVFFSDALSQYVFENAAAYRGGVAQDITQAEDWIAAEAGEGAYAYVTERSDGYDAALVVAVDDHGLSGAAPKARQRRLVGA